MNWQHYYLFIFYFVLQYFESSTVFCIIGTIPGGPKTEQSTFEDFALINSYPFSHCRIDRFFLIIITPRSSNLVENLIL